MSSSSAGEPPSGKVEIDEIRTIEALEHRTFAQRFLRFNPELTLFRTGFSLSIELIDFLGEIVPENSYDRTQRDLMCDTLDSLWLAEHALNHGYEAQALLILRRSYETTSLMAYFFDFPEKVQDWTEGKRIRQSTVRQALETAPVPEPKDLLDEMYRVYSLFSHVNRETLYQRLLGEPNHLTLGSQGNVDEKYVAVVVRELLGQMMWLVEVANFTFAKLGLKAPGDYAERMLAYRGQVQTLAKSLPALLSVKAPAVKSVQP